MQYDASRAEAALAAASWRGAATWLADGNTSDCAIRPCCLRSWVAYSAAKAGGRDPKKKKREVGVRVADGPA